MPDDGDVDVIVYSHEGMFGDAPRRLGQGDYGIRLAPEFWRKFYAGLAMQALMAWKTGSFPVYMMPGDVARRASEQANAMIAHKKNTEDDGETDNERR